MPIHEAMPNGGIAAVMFYVLAAITVGSTLLVVYSRSIVYAGFALLGTFLGVAGLFALLLSDFLAIAQLMVYVGGILVLILFAIMLTRQIGEVQVTNRSVGVVQGTILWLGLLAILVMLFVKTPWGAAIAPPAPGAGSLGALFDNTPQVDPTTVPLPTTRPLGDALLTTYLLPFEVASVVLLAALIGAVILARGLPQRKANRKAEIKSEIVATLKEGAKP
jgi:NADH-quinone oxidoreductase subunit J